MMHAVIERRQGSNPLTHTPRTAYKRAVSKPSPKTTPTKKSKTEKSEESVKRNVEIIRPQLDKLRGVKAIELEKSGRSLIVFCDFDEDYLCQRNIDAWLKSGLSKKILDEIISARFTLGLQNKFINIKFRDFFDAFGVIRQIENRNIEVQSSKLICKVTGFAFSRGIFKTVRLQYKGTCDLNRVQRVLLCYGVILNIEETKNEIVAKMFLENSRPFPEKWPGFNIKVLESQLIVTPHRFDSGPGVEDVRAILSSFCSEKQIKNVDMVLSDKLPKGEISASFSAAVSVDDLVSKMQLALGMNGNWEVKFEDYAPDKNDLDDEKIEWLKLS